VDWLVEDVLNGFDVARHELWWSVLRGVGVCKAWVLHALCGVP
jgi:hypothetical protein